MHYASYYIQICKICFTPHFSRRCIRIITCLIKQHSVQVNKNQYKLLTITRDIIPFIKLCYFFKRSYYIILCFERRCTDHIFFWTQGNISSIKTDIIIRGHNSIFRLVVWVLGCVRLLVVGQVREDVLWRVTVGVWVITTNPAGKRLLTWLIYHLY